MTRFQNIISNCQYYLSSYDKHLYNLNRTHPTSVQIYEDIINNKRYPDLILVNSLMGVNNIPFPISSNVKFYHIKQKLDPRESQTEQIFINFYSKFNKVMIASIDQRKSFDVDELIGFLNFAKTRDDWGVIIEIEYLKQFDSKIVKMLKYQHNIMIIHSFNHFKVLKMPEIKIIYCSGGKEVIYEAFNNGKAVVISPVQNQEHIYVCENIHALNIGRCLKQNVSEELLQAMSYIDDNDFLKDNYKQVKDAINFEQNNKEDFIFWIDYAFEQGLGHLYPTNFRKLSYTAGYEVDTHSLAYIMFLGSLVIIFSVLRKFIQYLKQYTSK
eukprot:403341384